MEQQEDGRRGDDSNRAVDDLSSLSPAQPQAHLPSPLAGHEQAEILARSEELVRRVLELQIINEGHRRTIFTAGYQENQVDGDAAYWEQLIHHNLAVHELIKRYGAHPESFSGKDVSNLVSAATKLKEILNTNYRHSLIHNRNTASAGSATLTEVERRFRDQLLAPWRVPADDVRIDTEQLLGSGGFGEVYAGRYKYRERDVAIKMLKAEYRDRIDDMYTELAMMLMAGNNSRVIPLVGFVALDNSLWMLTERAEYGSLDSVLHHTNEDVSMKARVEWLQDVSEAVVSLHNKGIIHRDIKPANIFIVTGRLRRIAELGDFGIACAAGDASDVAGTWMYMAPELRSGESVGSRESDLYSLGVTIAETLTRKRPSLVDSTRTAMALVEEGVANVMRDISDVKTETGKIIMAAYPHVDKKRLRSKLLSLLRSKEERKDVDPKLIFMFYGRYLPPHHQFPRDLFPLPDQSIRLQLQPTKSIGKSLEGTSWRDFRGFQVVGNGQIAVYHKSQIVVWDVDTDPCIARMRTLNGLRFHKWGFIGSNRFVGLEEINDSIDFLVWTLSIEGDCVQMGRLQNPDPFKEFTFLGQGIFYNKRVLCNGSGPTLLCHTFDHTINGAVMFSDRWWIAVRSEQSIFLFDTMLQQHSVYSFDCIITCMEVLHDGTRLIVGHEDRVSVLTINRETKEMETCWSTVIRLGCLIRQIVIMGNDTVIIRLRNNLMFVVSAMDGEVLRPLSHPNKHLTDSTLHRLARSSPWLVTNGPNNINNFNNSAWNTETGDYIPLSRNRFADDVWFLDDGRIVERKDSPSKEYPLCVIDVQAQIDAHLRR